MKREGINYISYALNEASGAAQPMNPLKDISRLFFPRVCAACGCVLPETGGLICNACRWKMPLTGFCERAQNPVKEKLHPLLPVVNACSFFFFVNGSDFRSLIHTFKYRGGWRIAEQMGRWFGEEMAGSGLYGDIDLIVPVPLHIRKRLRRGYNQSEYIANGISKAISVPVSAGSVVRDRYSQSQTERKKSERWDNVHGIFSVPDPEKLRGKHILLVDDVLTTGATLVSCGEAILNAVEDCRLSIATLAVSKNELRESRAKYHGKRYDPDTALSETPQE